jgi:16S rRNA (cytidine1402-2'-O)-methyltransferase
MIGKIILIPNTIGDADVSFLLPSEITIIVSSLKYFIVEDIRTARRFLKKLNSEIIIDDLVFFSLNKHTNKDDIQDFLNPVFSGNDIGLISEAGVPCVADPGNTIVELAHNFNVKVIPLVGPSSILLSLMASGLNGQNFAFNGYLPVNKNERISKIKMLETRSLRENQSQMFMEAPYRNNQLLDVVLSTCRANSMLCIACNITNSNEFIKTMTIDEWKMNKPDLNKKPSIFIIQAK